MYIYMLKNLITNKVYIGKTSVSIENRIKRHFKSAENNSNLYIHRAIRKYGKENFEFKQLDTATNLKELSQKEKYWIEYYKSYEKENGYNLTKGGEGGALVGEALERMKLHMKGKKPSLETLKKRSDALKGKLSGEKNPWYGKKSLNSGKTMEEFYGKEKANKIKLKIAQASKQAMLNSEKYKAWLKYNKDLYYKNPNYCIICHELIQYEPGYKHKTCDKCRNKKKGKK